MKIQEHVDSKKYSTFKIGGKFRYFVVIENKEDLPQIYAIAQKYGNWRDFPILILGGGSNIVFSDGVIDKLVVKIEIKGFEVLDETDGYVDIKVGAGENWDQFVEGAVDLGLMGIESLSLIPGTVGATPVQNVGAYGTEVKDTIVSVEAFDLKENKIVNIKNEDCKFGYRDSIFKNEAKGQYVITAVVFRLQKQDTKQCFLRHAQKQNLNKQGSEQYFLLHNKKQDIKQCFLRHAQQPDILKISDKSASRKKISVRHPALLEKRQEIIKTRQSKLPDPKVLPNVGSFFKNPIVKNEITDKIKMEYKEAKFFPIDDNYTKVPAGWLIEQTGLKGKSFGRIGVYEKNALVLVNNGQATKEELLKVKDEIVKIVSDKFGITLEQEPEIV